MDDPSQKQLGDWTGLTLQVEGPLCKQLSYAGRGRASGTEHGERSLLGKIKDEEKELALWQGLQFYSRDTSQAKKGPKSESSLQ